MPIGVIGDLHLKENLGYSEFVKDGRKKEIEDVLSFIVESLKDCGSIVFLGDQLNSRTNHAETIRRFVAFLECFGDRELYILIGNHERWGNGKSCLDFLSEIKGKKWQIIRDQEILQVEGVKCLFQSFISSPELQKTPDKTWQQLSDQICDGMPAADILFVHNAISGTSLGSIQADLLQEIVLPQPKLLDKFKTIVGGHIHLPGDYGRIHVAGSVFNDAMGEDGKNILKIDADSVERIQLPGRKLIKLENPTLQEIEEVTSFSVLKVVLTDKSWNIGIEALQKLLKRLDGHLIVENYPSERRQNGTEEIEDLSIENLLLIYAKNKNLNAEILLHGLELIK